ncbi:M28 family peptidase [Granulicella tundricola]|uniref:Peptidase M28 n=1 Tax=Granulicella tundricola (strain ATCC BAA-1859 / DSM 23138 / MP5ACTX9) TaxID=1198114 RepID=E8WYT7_GRATM|nr:M28 family peptidase [Granulicella tundricola]ADW68773.1 peptidase M28 [Granulicella tundricola MP5ACTX9]
MRLDRLAVGLMVGLMVAPVFGQAAWTVKPEWVRAHEEFLASDVMAGRGSATRDEEITATYVASEFMGYGLKMAPGMSSYLQAAEVVSPRLDGHAVLKAGGVTLNEGSDFTLLISSGADVSGPVAMVSGDLKTARVSKGAVVVVGALPAGQAGMQAIGAVQRSGPAMVVVGEDESTQGLYTMFGGKTRTPIRLKDAAAGRTRATIVSVSKAGMAKLAGLGSGTVLSLHVHVVPEATARKTFNAIGYLEGSEPGSGTILLTAHLDHLGIGAPVNGDSIYNGANDDAAGTTAVLELAHALAGGPKTRRNVLFVCYGSEEAGELGSTYFGEHPPVPLKELVANLEFEMIGTQDPKMPKGVLLLTGWERSNLGPTLKEHGALLGPDPYPEEHFFERSDNYALALQGVVAHTAAGWGTPPTYHKPDDDLAHLDIGFMTSAIQSLVEPVRWLATSDFKPAWNAGGEPKRQ